MTPFGTACLIYAAKHAKISPRLRHFPLKGTTGLREGNDCAVFPEGDSIG